MTTRFMVDWNEERIAALKAMWTEGHSCSQIASRLGNGITRNSVIGKVHRLNLHGVVRAPVARKSREKKPKDKPSLAVAAANGPKARRALLAPVPITATRLPASCSGFVIGPDSGTLTAIPDATLQYSYVKELASPTVN